MANTKGNIPYYGTRGTRNKLYAEMEKDIDITTDDYVLNWIIKQLHAKIVDEIINENNKELVYRLQHLIYKAADKLEDLTKTVGLLNNSSQSFDILLLIEILNRRLDKEKGNIEMITPYIHDMLSKSPSKDVIENQILVSDIRINKFEIENQLDKIIKLIISINDAKMVEHVNIILRSPRINELTPDTANKAILFVSSTLGISYNQMVDELITTYINNYKILNEIKKNIKDYESDNSNIKMTIAQIHVRIYEKVGYKSNAIKKMVPNTAKILKEYDNEILKEFVRSLTSKTINKTAGEFSHEQYDLVGIFLLLRKPELAMQVFKNKSYQPIDKTQRKYELSQNCYDYFNNVFDYRLKSIIEVCLSVADYVTLLSILQHKKVDSLSTPTIHDILLETTDRRGKCNNKRSFCDEKTRTLIIETIKQKITEEQLFVYRTRFYPNEHLESLIYDKEKAINYVDFVVNNIDMPFNKIMEEMHPNKGRIRKTYINGKHTTL